ncbi:hypothetical protein Lal_00008752 [Lupinus albus]|nr:hypothetical protein Lal_00008752 [Lupinus albus]
MQFDWSAIWPAIPLLLEGAKMTLWISVLGLVGGLIIGLVAGFARTYGGWIANHIALVFIEVIRGTPIVVQVMFIYFALPMAFTDLRIDPFSAAVVTIMINSGAYIAEITRGAVLSIHKGFSEAGLALGLSRRETIRHVILPLALRRMLPPLGNQWIISIKDTSLFIVIGVAELTRQGQEIIAGNFRALEIWSAVAVVYLIITLVLHNIDLNIKQGEVVVIIGPSGSGKSTLLRCINKLEEITSGDLIVDGLKVNDPKVDDRLIRQEAGMVFQQFYLFPHLTALENVMFGPLRVRGANKAAAEALAKDLLAKVGLAERAHHYPSELSGGQQQRVAIARALAVKPKLMLFDEPTSALDPELRHEVLKVMQDLAEEGMTMVIVTHEIGFAEKVASRLIFIDKGRIAEDGNPQELIANPPSPRLQEFLQHDAVPWILLLLISLFSAPSFAVAIPGVTTGTTASQQGTPPPEPDVEQKKAAYGALADVLENDTSRKELIEQLRKAAATPPQETVPTLTPPQVEEQKTVLENVTDVSRHYGEALSSRFAQLYRNLIGSPHKPFNPQTFTAAAMQFLMLAGAVFLFYWLKESAEKQLAAPAADDRLSLYHRFTAAGADAVLRPDAGRQAERGQQNHRLPAVAFPECLCPD